MIEHGLGTRGDERPVVLTIGSFDGVHLGHLRLMRHVTAAARRLHADATVVTFDPHPRCVVDPAGCPPRLGSVVENADRLRLAGADRVVVVPFTAELSSWRAERFCEALVDAFAVRRIVTGPNFAFGRAREGDIAFLRAFGAARGFDVVTVAPLVRRGGIVSSGRIRDALLNGHLDLANALLGRWYTLAGTIVRGAGRGAGLGFPTANLEVDPGRCVPAPGVYAGWLDAGRGWMAAATGIGFRPTFEAEPGTLTIEANVLDFEGDLYSAAARLALVKRLREERRYPSARALTAQMRRDVARVRRVLERAGSPP